MPPKETNKASITDPKEMQVCELSDKEIRVIILRKFRELQENTDRQQHKIRKIMHGQNEAFNKKIATTNKK